MLAKAGHLVEGEDFRSASTQPPRYSLRTPSEPPGFQNSSGGGVLGAHGRALTAHDRVLGAHGGVLKAHDGVLTAHGGVLGANGRVVDDQGGVLGAHGNVVRRQKH